MICMYVTHTCTYTCIYHLSIWTYKYVRRVVDQPFYHRESIVEAHTGRRVVPVSPRRSPCHSPQRKGDEGVEGGETPTKKCRKTLEYQLTSSHLQIHLRILIVLLTLVHCNVRHTIGGRVHKQSWSVQVTTRDTQTEGGCEASRASRGSTGVSK